jgi:uncharacterized membrane-anchored protein
MDERHIPPVSLRYWVLFLATSVCGAHLEDVVRKAVFGGGITQAVVLAGILALVFVAERYDRRASDTYYWSAVIIVQTMAVRFEDFSVLQLGINHFGLVIGLILLFAVTLIMSRSDENRVSSRLQLERPGPNAKPIADVPYWLGLFVASVLGSAVADLCAINFGLGPGRSAIAVMAVVMALLYLQRPTRPVRLHAFWLTTTLVRADGISIADMLVDGGRVQLGLALSAMLSVSVVVILLILWRPPRSPV